MEKVLEKFNIKRKKELIDLIKQFLKFGVIGGVNTILSYVLTNLAFYTFGLNEQISNCIAFIITVFIAFFLNRKFVFVPDENNNNGLLKQMAKVYASYSITGLFLTAFLLFIEERHFGIPHYIATLINLVITVPLNFIFNKLWAFK